MKPKQTQEPQRGLGVGASAESELTVEGHGLERWSHVSVGLGVAVPEHFSEMPGCEVSSRQAEESALHSVKNTPHTSSKGRRPSALPCSHCDIDLGWGQGERRLKDGLES